MSILYLFCIAHVESFRLKKNLWSITRNYPVCDSRSDELLDVAFWLNNTHNKKTYPRRGLDVQLQTAAPFIINASKDLQH